MDDNQCDRLRYRGTLLKQYVLAQLPDTASALASEPAWQSFMQYCTQRGNILPELLARTECQEPNPGIFKRRGRRKPKNSDPFADLPPSKRLKANLEFDRLCRRWAPDLPSWRRAILAGVARRLTLYPPDSEWGRRMRRIKGGVHCQRKYREQGPHPLTRFNRAMAKRHLRIKTKNDEPIVNLKTRTAQARERLGTTAKQMQGRAKIAPLLESVEGSILAVIEALRWSHDEEAVAFLAKYDSIVAADLKYLSLDEICGAAAVDGQKFLSVALDSMLETAILDAKLHCAVSLVNVTQAAIERALTPNGWRDRQLILQVGLAPSPASRRSS
jgi:hypothetical protein